MKKNRLFVLAISLIVIGVIGIYFIDGSSGMMGRGMMGGGMMDDMRLMNNWVSGIPVPVDYTTPRPPETDDTVRAGRQIYEAACVVCHGKTGDGNGEKAGELQTKPRDFTLGLYKFRSTPSGAPPTDADIFKTVSRGLHGTAMLPWLGLTTTQKWLVTYYIKSFSNFFGFYYSEGNEKVIVKVPRPSMSEKEYIALGKETYKKAKCFECHGEEGYGDGKEADKLKDDWYVPIRPTNFHEQLMKRGQEIEDIYMTLATGLNGAPMPAYAPALTEEELLSLAYYVKTMEPEISGGKGMMRQMMGSADNDVERGMKIDHVMMPVR